MPHFDIVYAAVTPHWRPASISENCSTLVHIPAATEDRLQSTVCLLNLLILGHHRFIIILLIFVKCHCNGFIV